MKTEPAQTPQAAQQEIPGQEAKVSRKTALTARQANAEKQRRYRASMKAQGYKAKLIWEKPPEPGWVRVAVPVIRETSLNVATTDLAIKDVLENLCGAFITACEKQGVSKGVWEPVHRDLLTLLKPLAGK